MAARACDVRARCRPSFWRSTRVHTRARARFFFISRHGGAAARTRKRPRLVWGGGLRRKAGGGERESEMRETTKKHSISDNFLVDERFSERVRWPAAALGAAAACGHTRGAPFFPPRRAQPQRVFQHFTQLSKQTKHPARLPLRRVPLVHAARARARAGSRHCFFWAF